ncbi:hypothetical protein JCM11641_001101 [Rhodosporidiobolus odoratus]
MPLNNRKRQSDYAGKQPHQKRRKGVPPTHDGDQVQADPVAQEKALKAYLHHAVKLLNKAVKKGKTFELQKLTRKLKSTREPKDGSAVDAAQVAELDAQLQAIKTLPLEALPSYLLTTRLPKLSCLRSSSFLPSLLASIPSPTGKGKSASTSSSSTDLDPLSPEGKARNRVLAGKVVGEAWSEIDRAIKKRMGEEVDGKGKKTEEEVKGKEEEKKKGIQMDPGRAAALESALLAGAAVEQEDGAEGESSEDEGPVAGFSSGEEDGDDNEGEDDDEAIQAELDALNGDTGSEGDWSGSEEDDEGDDDAASIASDSSFPAVSAKSISTANKKRALPSPSPPPAKKAKASAKPAKPITSSSFLPSLAAGYVSYSDSDGEDAKWIRDAEKEDKKGQRKNRRGQRARQAIWEKKFGSAANHITKASGGKAVPLAKMKEQKAKRAAAAALAETQPPAPQEPFDIKHSRGGSANPNAQSLGKSRAFGAGVAAALGEKMHPSWEAKRKQKEAMQAMNVGAAPQGKKITFD